MTGESPTPRRLRRVVFGYTTDQFPGMLIVGYNQLKSKLARAGFDVNVSFDPLHDLPSDLDILLVPLALVDEARLAAPNADIVGLDTLVNHPFFTTLIKWLREGTAWTAPPAPDSTTEPDKGEIRRYRGYERID